VIWSFKRKRTPMEITSNTRPSFVHMAGWNNLEKTIGRPILLCTNDVFSLIVDTCVDPWTPQLQPWFYIGLHTAPHWCWHVS
jgi:hypothetical protein